MPPPPQIFQPDLPEQHRLISNHIAVKGILKKIKSQGGRKPLCRKGLFLRSQSTYSPVISSEPLFTFLLCRDMWIHIIYHSISTKYQNAKYQKTIQKSVNCLHLLHIQINPVQVNKYVLSPFWAPGSLTPGGHIKTKTTLGLPSQLAEGCGPGPFRNSTFV